MPVGRSMFKPDSAESSASEEATQLENQLQRQLEEDIARIFDESIYSDVEVICGRCKVLTHSCILKARSLKFYRKLESILHVNIGRDTYDEIYSFLSDAYTECNIEHQEREIIKYLDQNIHVLRTVAKRPLVLTEYKEESEVFLTPYTTNNDSISSSPSTDLTKEYYALVPIETNLLERELGEQDAISHAFQSINRTQCNTTSEVTPQRVKPTTLYLTSSHSSKTNQHSNSCDTFYEAPIKTYYYSRSTGCNGENVSQTIYTDDPNALDGPVVDKVQDSVYSPDSLITDEPSSSSDYLSAAYTYSPGVNNSTGCTQQLNVGDNASNMETVCTGSDSGLENTGMLERSQKDTISSTESTLDLTIDDASGGSQETTSSNQDKENSQKTKIMNSPPSVAGIDSGQSRNTLDDSKENLGKAEKQRQNEEIVMMESSSLSSETGSWESVFPNHRENQSEQVNPSTSQNNDSNMVIDENRPDITQAQCSASKSTVKASACFIDAASLVDDVEDYVPFEVNTNEQTLTGPPTLPAPSQPVPCLTLNKEDLSPVDRSESNENTDSLEQTDKQDATNNTQKDLSPTIFEVSPTQEDPNSSVPFEHIELTSKTFINQKLIQQAYPLEKNRFPRMSSTPNNSMSSLSVTNAARNEANENESNNASSSHSTDPPYPPGYLPRPDLAPDDYIGDSSSEDDDYDDDDPDDYDEETDEAEIVANAVVHDENGFCRIDPLGEHSFPSFTPEKLLHTMLMPGAVTVVKELKTALPPRLNGTGLIQPEFRRIPLEDVQPRVPWLVPTRPFIPYHHVDSFPSFLVRPAYPPDWSNNNPNEPNNPPRADEGQRNQEPVYQRAQAPNNGPNVPLNNSCQAQRVENIPRNNLSNVQRIENNLSNNIRNAHRIAMNLANNPQRVANNSVNNSCNAQRVGNIATNNVFNAQMVEHNPINNSCNAERVQNNPTNNTCNAQRVENNQSNSGWNGQRVENNPTNNSCNAPRVENNPTNNSCNTQSVENDPTNNSCNAQSVENNPENMQRNNNAQALPDSTGKSQKFFIDLSCLPDRVPEKTPEKTSETNNMFSMYIDLGDASNKKKPAKREAVDKETKNEAAEKEPEKKDSVKKEFMKQEPPKKDTSKQDSIKKELHPRLMSLLNSKKSIASTSPSRARPMDSTCTFEKLEKLCNDPNISISDIIKKDPMTSSDPRDASLRHSAKQGKEPGAGKAEGQASGMFVKLSDLDKPSTSSGKNEEKVRDSRMTRSIPENNWGARRQANSSRSADVISSFHSENALSLNRLFPHLKNGFSKSMTGSVSSRARSPQRVGQGDGDDQDSDASDSNVQSSAGPSTMESSPTEDNSHVSSLIGSCQSRLGQDLLRMFLEEIAPDVIVEAAGRRIKAHKCILSSRCQYFAGILSGGWVESAGNVISLPSFTFNVVHFALCHIYSGVCTIPDSISLVELATLADMLGLEGLKEAIMFTLKAKYCHHFHYPCPVCVAGVLECITLCALYGLDDLFRKCVLWISKHFTTVWPTKSFATLPSEILEKCYQNIVINLTCENVIDVVFGCGITVGALVPGRWAEGVARLCRRLLNTTAHFVSMRLMILLRYVETLPGGLPRHARTALDDCFAAAIERAQPDEACRAYDYLSTVVRDIASQAYCKPDLLANDIPVNGDIEPDNLLAIQAVSLLRQVENALVRAAPRVVTTQGFRELPPELRMKLRNLGCIMYGPHAIPNSPQRERFQRNVHPGPSSGYGFSGRPSSGYGTGPASKPTTSAKPSTSTYASNRTAASASAGASSCTGTGTATGTSTSTCTGARPKIKTTNVNVGGNAIEHVRSSFVPYSPSPVVVTAGQSQSPRSVVKPPTTVRATPPPPVIRTTKAQEERAKYNKIKNCSSQDNIDKRSQRATVENRSPSYLDSRSLKEEKKRANRKLGPQMFSSSESSRNSSPVLARRERASRAPVRDESPATPHPHTPEPSTDSLTESQSNIYATYTKSKHASGSDASVKPKCLKVAQAKPLKTKIPVYTNQNTNLSSTVKNPNEGRKATRPSKPAESGANALSLPSRSKPERKLPGSLMNATKSSSAKMQPKIVKDSPKPTPKTNKSAGTSKPDNKTPVMERSGTFLKDEPTFGDNTFDIDQ